jgi:hypothetical protein
MKRYIKLQLCCRLQEKDSKTLWPQVSVLQEMTIISKEAGKAPGWDVKTSMPAFFCGIGCLQISVTTVLGMLEKVFATSSNPSC